jgi:hypothetical protein
MLAATFPIVCCQRAQFVVRRLLADAASSHSADRPPLDCAQHERNRDPSACLHTAAGRTRPVSQSTENSVFAQHVVDTRQQEPILRCDRKLSSNISPRKFSLGRKPLQIFARLFSRGPRSIGRRQNFYRLGR